MRVVVKHWETFTASHRLEMESKLNELEAANWEIHDVLYVEDEWVIVASQERAEERDVKRIPVWEFRR